MKAFLIALAVGSLVHPAGHAADLAVTGPARTHLPTPKRVWIRRATLVAGCAASLIFDTLSTRRAISAGAVEGNGLLADSQGRPQWGRMIGLKAGLCGTSALVEETHTFRSWKGPNADWTWTAVNLGTTTAFTWAGFHNLSLANDLFSH